MVGTTVKIDMFNKVFLCLCVALDSVDSIQWYYKEMDEEQGKDILNDKQCGTYLIRDCQSSKGNFTLMWK